MEAEELRKQQITEAEKIRQIRIDKDWEAYWESYRESFALAALTGNTRREHLDIKGVLVWEAEFNCPVCGIGWAHQDNSEKKGGTK